jgi:hypothetical protein
VYRVPADVIDRISSRVESMQDELVSFLKDIVRIPTENPPGGITVNAPRR